MIFRVLAAVASLLAMWVGARRLFGARVERQVSSRHARGRDGIIVGAESIALAGEPGGPSVLLLHGFGDTPQSLRRLALHLHDALGWSVHAPLLPGHGRDLRAFGRTDARAWLDAARVALEGLCRAGAPVALVGQSMGGALAVRLAAERSDLAALVLLAPYLGMKPHVDRLARRYRLVSLATAYVNSRADASIRDPDARASSLGYGVAPPRLLHELRCVAREAWEALPRVRTPTLVLQSRDDNRIRPADAEHAFARLGADPKALVWTTGNGHVLSVDFGCDDVFRRTADWLARFTSAAGP
ncbi:MAG TPA: alpha/beta fold hydrolase [Gemmatimonadaceae bacterium]|nr:alpha/beta fold hydrolase [Gemmatimonadaceae bacterium]